MVCNDPPSVLPPYSGVRDEIDLVSMTKYCVTRQWPIPKEQGDVIDDVVRAKHEAEMVRESNFHIRHRQFVSKKKAVRQVAYYSCLQQAMRTLFRHRNPFLDTTSSKQHG